MIRIEELSPDQRAVLSLLLRQRKRYDELAAALDVPASAVHDRAHAALAVLAPGKARLIEQPVREQIGEYLLGQQDEEQAAATKASLANSSAAREWARALAVELSKLAAQPLPEIPAAEQTAGISAAEQTAGISAGEQTAGISAGEQTRNADARADNDAASETHAAGASPRLAASGVPASPPSPRPAAPISRRGGAILLSVIAAVVIAIVAVVLVAGKSGGPNAGANQTASHSNANSGTGATGQHGGGSGNASTPNAANTSIEKVAELKPVGSGSAAKGAAAIAAENGKHAVLLSATGMPRTNGFFYVVWLIDSEGKITVFGRTPSVGSKGTVRAVELLSANPATVSGIELTRETTEHPSSPGTVVLRGVFNHA
jgi:hypothetical protein